MPAMIDFRQFVVKKVKKSGKDRSLWLNCGLYSSTEVQTLLNLLKTTSPAEIAQIVVKTFGGIANGSLKLVRA